MSKINELADVVSLILDVLQDVQSATSDDEKVGITEGAGIVIKNVAGLLAAIKDCTKIAEELKSLDADGVEKLADLVFPNIGFSTEAKRECTNRVVGVLVQIVHLWQFIRDIENWTNPPRAAIVE